MALTQRRLSFFAIAALIGAMALAFTLEAAVDSPPSALAKKKSKCAKGKEKQGCLLPANTKFEGSGPNGRILLTISKDETVVEVSGTVKCGSNPTPFPLVGQGRSEDKPKVGSTLDIEGVESTFSGMAGGTVKILNATTAKADLTVADSPAAVCPGDVKATLHRK